MIYIKNIEIILRDKMNGKQVNDEDMTFIKNPQKYLKIKNKKTIRLKILFKSKS